MMFRDHGLIPVSFKEGASRCVSNGCGRNSNPACSLEASRTEPHYFNPEGHSQHESGRKAVKSFTWGGSLDVLLIFDLFCKASISLVVNVSWTTTKVLIPIREDVSVTIRCFACPY